MIITPPTPSLTLPLKGEGIECAGEYNWIPLSPFTGGGLGRGVPATIPVLPEVDPC